MKTMSVRDILVSMANMRGWTVLDITRQYNQFVCGERMFAYSGAAVSNDGHKQLSKDDVSAILANNGFTISNGTLEFPVRHIGIPMPNVFEPNIYIAIEDAQFRKSIRSNMPSIMDAVAGVTVQDDKPELDKYFNKYETVPDIAPMPQPTQRVGIYIDIDNDNVENSDANCTGSVSDLSAALMMAVSINDKMLMPVIIAAAALTADKPELRKKYDDLVVYFSKTPQHG